MGQGDAESYGFAVWTYRRFDEYFCTCTFVRTPELAANGVNPFLMHLDHVTDMCASVQTNNMEKAFLFDINAKFNVAADDSITETKNFHLSTDYIGKMLAFQSLFEYVTIVAVPHLASVLTALIPLCTHSENYQKRENKRSGLRKGTTMETMKMTRTGKMNVTLNGHRKR